MSESLIFAHFIIFGERCEWIAHFAHIKWAMWANRSFRSPKSKWVNRSFFWANRSFANFWTKKERFAWKSNERIPSPGKAVVLFLYKSTNARTNRLNCLRISAGNRVTMHTAESEFKSLLVSACFKGTISRVEVNKTYKYDSVCHVHCGVRISELHVRISRRNWIEFENSLACLSGA